MKITNSNAAGILCESSENLVIMNNQTYNTVSSGIGVWDSKNILIDSNEVELACNDGEKECISVAMTDSFEICYNHVHHNGPGTNGGEGIDAKDGAKNGLIHHNIVHDLTRLGIYVDAWDKHTYNIEVYNNVVYNCSAYGFAIASEAGGLLEDVKLYNNLAYNNQYIGISITGHGQPVPNHPIHNIIIINNSTGNEFIIEYILPCDLYIDINIYNLSGQLIEVLEYGNRQKGQYSIIWNADDDRGETISSGLYFINLRTEIDEVTEKIFLLN